MSGKGLELLEAKLTASQASKPAVVGFDPLTILAIISALLPILQKCLAPTPKALRRRFLNRSRVATAIRQECNCSWAQAMAEADNLFDLADSSSDQELQLLIDDAK